MGALIVLDPNVLRAAAEGHRYSAWALEELVDREVVYQIAVDSNGNKSRIFDELFEISSEFVTNPYVSAFIALFINRNQQRVARIRDATLTEDEQSWLKAEGCDTPVEPQLIAVGRKAPRETYVLILNGSCKSAKLPSRGTDDTKKVDKICDKFKTIRFWPVNRINALRNQIKLHRYPASEAHLCQFLADVESETVEFKQPQLNDTGVYELTHSIVRDAWKAACGLLNNVGGYVAIGVDDDGTIHGVRAANNKGELINDDDLSKRLTDELCHFTPRAALHFSVTLVPLINGNRVILIHVSQGDAAPTYKYRNQCYKRVATTTQRCR